MAPIRTKEGHLTLDARGRGEAAFITAMSSDVICDTGLMGKPASTKHQSGMSVTYTIEQMSVTGLRSAAALNLSEAGKRMCSWVSETVNKG